jgi:flagellar hook assembly protein FlgD
VFGKLLIIAALAGIAALPAGATRSTATQIVAQSLLMPGVSYQREVEFTPHGPVVLDVVTAPRPDGSLYTLAPVLSNNAIVATEKLTDMQKAGSATSTAVGVNGDYFAPNPGKPTGILMRGGVVESAPTAQRSSLGISADGTLTVARVAFDGTWRGNGQRRQLDLNAAPVRGHTTLYTSTWGPATPAETGVAVVVIPSLPPLTPNRIAAGVASQIANAGPVTIPPGGAVLVSRGNQAPHLTTEAPIGTTIEIRPTLTPNWSGMASAIGGGPLLVAAGKPVFRAREAFGDPVLNRRSARSAVGQLGDGRILLVAVEGGGYAYSVGMTNYELAVALARLGAQTAIGLGSGPTTTMAFDGTTLTRGAEQQISDGLMLSYNGVYAAPLASTTLSPNDDGVDDVQTFSYKLVRPSRVTASVVGPDRTPRVLAQADEQPGVHTLQWDGSGAPEGTWRFSVTGVDDLGRSTVAERPFALNQTLASLSVTPKVGGLAAAFELAHQANVTVTVERANGIVVATLLSKKLDAGAQSVSWNGAAAAGYRVRVVAANSIGKATLLAPVTSRHS